MNWQLLVIFGIAVLALLIFLIAKNLKDKRELENKIKQDYKKSKDEEGDIDLDDTKV
jgi:hypothetical protein